MLTPLKSSKKNVLKRSFDLKKRFGSHGGRMIRISTERWRSKRGRLVRVPLHGPLPGVQSRERYRVLLPML